VRATQVRLKIDRRKLFWLKFVMESYEGLALTTTLDAASGLVLISIAPGAEAEVAGLLARMKADLGVTEGLSDLMALIPNRDHEISAEHQ